MPDRARNWFTVKADIQIAEPEIDEATGEYHGGALATKELSQEMLKELAEGDGHFVLRVDGDPDELWLRVCRSNAARSSRKGGRAAKERVPERRPI